MFNTSEIESILRKDYWYRDTVTAPVVKSEYLSDYVNELIMTNAKVPIVDITTVLSGVEYKVTFVDGFISPCAIVDYTTKSITMEFNITHVDSLFR